MNELIEEYEKMRSKFLIQYLIEKYKYKCFEEFDMQLQKQDNDMPDAFKNIFSLHIFMLMEVLVMCVVLIIPESEFIMFDDKCKTYFGLNESIIRDYFASWKMHI